MSWDAQYHVNRLCLTWLNSHPAIFNFRHSLPQFGRQPLYLKKKKSGLQLSFFIKLIVLVDCVTVKLLIIYADTGSECWAVSTPLLRVDNVHFSQSLSSFLYALLFCLPFPQAVDGCPSLTLVLLTFLPVKNGFLHPSVSKYWLIGNHLIIGVYCPMASTMKTSSSMKFCFL